MTLLNDVIQLAIVTTATAVIFAVMAGIIG
jgi:hypothetical protein